MNVTSVKYRQAHHQDIVSLSSLLQILFQQEREFDPNEELQKSALEKILIHPDLGDIFVAEKEDTMCGMVIVLYTISTALGSKVGLLEDMIVDPRYQNQTIGSQLLDYALASAKQRGCKRITLLSDADNAPAHRFYEKKGFIKSTMIPMRALF